MAGLAVLFLALVGVGTWFWISHQRARTTLSVVTAQAELAPLQGRLTEAQRELSQIRYVNDYTKPKEAFNRIAVDAQNKQPIYDWARLQQGVAAMIGNETSPARDAFKEVVKAGETGFAQQDADLAKFFMSAARNLGGDKPIPADTNLNPANYEAFAMFAYGLKSIETLDANGAVTFLENFNKAKPTGQHAWIADYKTLAQKYIDDCKLYLDWKKEGDEAHDAAAFARHMENTKAITSKRRFKMHSAISEVVFDAKNTLPKQFSEQQKADTANREQEKTKQAQQLAQKKSQWLNAWKSKLIADLNQSHFAGTIADASGVQFTGILKATPATMTMQNPYGTVELPWAKLPQKALLDVSASFAKPNAPDAADRLWLCAVYAAETGQTDAAKRLADEAGKSKPEYRDEGLLLLGASPAQK